MLYGAGRMQDNEPLMRALSNLIVVNSPDLVLFVGEALVGNDAVDQLTKFNQRLADLAQDAATAHTIDGILLTKFDTIDDKVGPALSPATCKRSGQPCGEGVAASSSMDCLAAAEPLRAGVAAECSDCVAKSVRASRPRAAY